MIAGRFFGFARKKEDVLLSENNLVHNIEKALTNMYCQLQKN